ncbi:MAG: FHA domain-containing protein [Chloroflexi bacterium]|nr:FHA domain-containing protein [Chloroflexota bacterium]
MLADFYLDYDRLTAGQAHTIYLMARLMSGPAPASQRRLPLNLGLVIDRSGSMAGDKIAFTRQAAQFLVQNLGPNDTLSVVLYNHEIETLQPPQRVTHKDAITQRIGAIKTGGTTNLSGGWLEGCNLVAQNLGGEQLNRVIIMSDGLANRGITDSARLVALAQQKREQGISTTTMGLGADFNEDLLMAMADAGGGAFYFIESPEVAPLIFEEELRGLLSMVGQNLSVQLEFSDYIDAVRQLNAYPSETGAKHVAYRLGDIFADEVKTLVLELSIPALAEVGEYRVATLRFDYDELTPDGSHHRTLELPIRVTVVPYAALLPPPNKDVRRSVLLLQAAQARREAVQAADRGEFVEASQVLRSVAEAIEESQIISPDLEEERNALLVQASEIESGDSYDKLSRKFMQTQAFYTMTDWHEGTQNLRTREMERVVKPSPIIKKPGVIPTLLVWNNRQYPLDKDLIRIGRAAQNDIIIDRRSVSRFHGQITRQNDALVLEDLSSTNGTYVNEIRLEGQPHTLSVGDVVRFGDEQVIFHDAPPE